jgi:hypothetical protein
MKAEARYSDRERVNKWTKKEIEGFSIHKKCPGFSQAALQAYMETLQWIFPVELIYANEILKKKKTYRTGKML